MSQQTREAVALPNVGGPHQLHGRPKESKKAEDEGTPAAPTASCWDPGLLLPLDLKHQLFLGVQPASLQTGPYTKGFSGSRALDSDWDFSAFISK